jgi:glycosyltransferase involved in cell wall biosynthesis
MKHCIVTPDIIGPVKNGGIGTANFHLAKFLSGELRHDVSILFTGPIENETASFWANYYKKEFNIDFFSIDLTLYAEPIHNGYWFMVRSHLVDLWLRERNFDQIHFQEWQGNGFVPIQAKKAGIKSYKNTLLTCTVHSSHEWINEGSQNFHKNGITDMLQKYVEKYSAENADITVFPSRHMFDWCTKQKWKIQNAQIIQYITCGDSFSVPDNQKKQTYVSFRTKIESICFFGRLETRKGLEVFIEAIKLMSLNKEINFLPKISFIGKEGLVNHQNAIQYIDSNLSKLGVKYEIHSNFDSAGAIKFLKSQQGALTVVPSLLDNLPYTVIECLDNDIPIIASSVGGIPELIGSKEHLFDPTPSSLSNCIQNILEQKTIETRSIYNNNKAKKSWELLVEETKKIDFTKDYKGTDVTICIAYFNYGKFLPALLCSLEKQTTNNFSLVLVNDGSSDDFSNIVFEELKTKYSNKKHWKFFHKVNGGIGSARNFAASQAETELIVFMDADNEAEPTMIESMLNGINSSNADCLTCYMTGFEESDCVSKKIVYRYLPTGGCISAAIFQNCLGDANFIIKKSIFDRLGGFNADRSSSFEDWEFLLHLLLEGYSLDVIPDFLFLYRHTHSGFSRNTSVYRNHMRVISRLKNYVPEYMFEMTKGIYAIVNPEVIPSFAEKKALKSQQSITEISSNPEKSSNFFQRFLFSLSDSFDEKNYLNKHFLVMQTGSFKWYKHPKIHFILFNFAH